MTPSDLISKHQVWSDELNEYVIPVSKLEEAIEEFKGKPFEDKLKQLDSAMQELNKMFDDLGNKIND